MDDVGEIQDQNEQERSSTTVGGMNRHGKRPSVQSTGMESVGRVNGINHSSHMASTQEMLGCEHNQGCDLCAHQAGGGGGVVSSLIFPRALFGLNKVNLVGSHSFARQLKNCF